jgi:RNA 3'-terminal phosphate cyclase (ATP)
MFLECVFEDVRSGATVDRHLADQIVLFCALVRGSAAYIVPDDSDHVDGTLWLVSQDETGKVTNGGLEMGRPKCASDEQPERGVLRPALR